MPSVAGTEHDAGKPRTPSICTRQVRQAPIAGMSGSLQSWEMATPAALIASSADAPAETETGRPSTLTTMAGGAGGLVVVVMVGSVGFTLNLTLSRRGRGD